MNTTNTEIVEKDFRYTVLKHQEGLYQIYIHGTNPELIINAIKYNKFGNKIFYVKQPYYTLCYIDLTTHKETHVSQSSDYKIENIGGKNLLIVNSQRIFDEAGHEKGDYRYNFSLIEKNGTKYLCDVNNNMGTDMFKSISSDGCWYSTTTLDIDAVFHKCIDARTGDEKLYDILGRESYQETASGQEIYDFYHNPQYKLSDLTPRFLVDDCYYNTVVRIARERNNDLIRKIPASYSKREAEILKERINQPLVQLKKTRKKAIRAAKLRSLFSSKEDLEDVFHQ